MSLSLRIIVGLILILKWTNFLEAADKKIMILHVSEKNNLPARNGVDCAINYLNMNRRFKSKADIQHLIINASNSADVLGSLCKSYQSLLDIKQPPHLILDTTTTKSLSKMVRLFSSALGIPTVTTLTNKLEKPVPNNIVSIAPPRSMVKDFIKAIIDYHELYSAAFIFDENVDSNIKSLIFKATVLEFSSNINEQVKVLIDKNIRHFFCFASVANIRTILNEIGHYLTDKDDPVAWYFVTLEEVIWQGNENYSTVLFAKPTIETTAFYNFLINAYDFNPIQFVSSAFYFDVTIRSIGGICSLFDSTSFPKNIDYLSCREEYNRTNSKKEIVPFKEHFLKNYFKTFNYTPMNLTSSGDVFMKYEMLISIPCDGSKLCSAGSWYAGDPGGVHLTKQIPNVPTILRVVAEIMEPTFYEDPSAPYNFSGFYVDVLEYIAIRKNFKYRMYATDKPGNLDEQNRWNGSIRELLDDRADIATGMLSITLQREAFVDFTIPSTVFSGFQILMKTPKTKIEFFKFLTVLTGNVWICIIASYFSTSFLLWVFSRWSPYSYRNNNKQVPNEKGREFDLRECLWFCLTSLTPQGGGVVPKNLSGQLLSATWWIFGFIIIASYTANLAAFMTVSRLQTPIQSLDDLFKQTGIKYAPHLDSEAYVFFKNMMQIEKLFFEKWKNMSLTRGKNYSKIESAKLAVWNNPVSNKYTYFFKYLDKIPATREEAVERVKRSISPNEGFAYIGEFAFARYLEITDCDVQLVGKQFSRRPHAMGLQKGSPLKERIDSVLFHLTRSGDRNRLVQKWYSGHPKAKICNRTDSQSVEFKNLAGLFILLFAGIGLALATLICEYLWFKKRKAKIIHIS